MISIVFILMGVVTALTVFAILARIYAGEPKRAEKWEKGEIIKQLLALSERENSISVIASPPARNLRLAPTSAATRNDTSRKCTRREHPNPPIPRTPNPTDAEIEEQIRQRAYELYQERGGLDGTQPMTGGKQGRRC